MGKENNILYNKFGRDDLKNQLSQETFNRTTISFYKYVIIKSPVSLRRNLFLRWNNLKIKGRIYLACEGINAQLSCPNHNLENFRNCIDTIKELENIPFKIALDENKISFLKLTIKVRETILSDGLDGGDYDVTNVGKHLTAEEWNKYIDAGATIVDVRNHYESRIGHFKGALCPDVDTFREELPIIKERLKKKKNDKILLYCTGGIRCEKTSAYLKHHGFKDVNQLYGGIIDYVKQVKEGGLKNKFVGKNFVFDNRLGEKISDDTISACDQCAESCDDYTNCNYVDCNLLFLQCKKCAKKYAGCCTENCKKMAMLPKKEQTEIRKTRKNPSLIFFKKSIRPQENITEIKRNT